MSELGHFYRIATILRTAGSPPITDVQVRLGIGLKLADSGRRRIASASCRSGSPNLDLEAFREHAMTVWREE
jgi:hypothetical protein